MITPTNLGKILDPNKSIESGYGVMANGAGYSVTETIMDEVTFEEYNRYQK